MNAEPTTSNTRPHATRGESFLVRMDQHLAPRFGAPGSISSALAAMRRARRRGA